LQSRPVMDMAQQVTVLEDGTVILYKTTDDKGESEFLIKALKDKQEKVSFQLEAGEYLDGSLIPQMSPNTLVENGLHDGVAFVKPFSNKIFKITPTGLQVQAEILPESLFASEVELRKHFEKEADIRTIEKIGWIKKGLYELEWNTLRMFIFRDD